MVADDRIFVHKLDGVEVDDVIQFNKVLLVGTPNDTMVGRPHVQQVRVLGSIEEHVRDATTYIYKRRRAKGYRRFRGFRAVRLPASMALRANMLCAIYELCIRIARLPHEIFCAGVDSCAHPGYLGC